MYIEGNKGFSILASMYIGMGLFKSGSILSFTNRQACRLTDVPTIISCLICYSSIQAIHHLHQQLFANSRARSTP